MIDLHSHVLPGLDDGAVDVQQSLEILQAMAADGVRIVAATPHVRDDYPTTPAQMRSALEAVRSAASAAGIPIEVISGGELAAETVLRVDDETLRAFGLGGRPLVLMETPYHGWSNVIEAAAERLRRSAMTPLLAHPERNPAVQRRPELLASLVGEGVVVQLTAASLEGRLGREARTAAFALLRGGLAHLVASDAHAPEVRRAGVSSIADALDNPPLATWLTEEVPAALLAGAVLPPAPAVRRRRFKLGR